MTVPIQDLKLSDPAKARQDPPILSVMISKLS